MIQETPRLTVAMERLREVTAGAVGSEDHKVEYTALGDTVNLKPRRRPQLGPCLSARGGR